MPLSIEDFIKQVKDEVNFLFDSYSYLNKSKDLAFTQWMMGVLFPTLDPDSAFNSLIQDKSDGYGANYRDDESGTFYLIDARYSDSPKQAKFGEGIFHNLLKAYQRIQSDDKSLLNAKSILAEAAQAKKDGYNIIAILSVFGSLENSVDLESLRKSFDVDDQQFKYYDLSTLRRLCSGTDNEIPTASITLPFLSSAKFAGGPVQALVGNVAISSYRGAVYKLGSQLYDANLRNPLGVTKINKEMDQTIKEEPSLFWYYNNGVTMLCKRFRPHPKRRGVFIIDSPRIVNGAQTTAAILSADPGEDNPGALMVRVISALPGSRQVAKELAEEPDALEDLYLDIARYTNNVNQE